MSEFKPEKLCVPTEVLDQHLVMLGKTGAGKSSALRHVVEHLLSRGKRVCVIDPKGDWWGLKVAADGKGPGLKVILFGDFKNEAARDVPINDRSGKHIAELVAGGNRPCVIGLRGWTQGGMTRFWIDFASTLFARNAGELYLVGDEFHNFAPKQWKGQSDKDTPVGVGLHWSNRLLSEGRGLGLVCLIASQRPQKVHNDTLTSCETLVAMRVVHAADRAAVKAWIDGNGDAELGQKVLNSLAGMPRGEGWVWSPESGFGPKQISFPMFRTFDSFAPPQLQKKVVNKGWADVDLTAVTKELAAVIEEEKAKDPVELKKQLAAAQAELRKLQHSKPAPAAAAKVEQKIVEKLIVSDKQLLRLEQLAKKLEEIVPKAGAVLAQIAERQAAAKAIGDDIASVVREIGTAIAAARHTSTNNTPRGRNPGPSAAAVRTVTAGGSGHTTKPASAVSAPAVGAQDVGDVSELDWFRPAHARLLNALAWLESVGIMHAERSIAAAIAGVSPRSSSFTNDVSRLSSGGLITYPGQGLIQLTDAGRGIARFPQQPGSLADLHEAWRRSPAMRPAHVRLIDVLIENHPGEMTREQLAEAAGVSANSSSFTNDVSRLSSLRLARYPGPGRVAAGPMLFPEGLA